jgi:hypothetical protein
MHQRRFAVNRSRLMWVLADVVGLFSINWARSHTFQGHRFRSHFDALEWLATPAFSHKCSSWAMSKASLFLVLRGSYSVFYGQ